MDGFYGNKTEGPIPGAPGCHYYNAPTNHIAQIIAQTIEINTLRSKVSTLELLLSQCQKEKGEMQQVNHYLLNLNAQAALDASSLNVLRPGIRHRCEDGAPAEGDLKDLLKTIVNLLEKISDARTPTHSPSPCPDTHHVRGDLLGSFNEGSVSRARDSQSDLCIKPLLPVQNVSPFDNLEIGETTSHSPDGNVKDLPDLSASNHAHPPTQDCKSVDIAQNLNGDTPSSPSSLNESHSNLSDSTHSDGRDSGSTVVTPLNSFSTKVDIDERWSRLTSKSEGENVNDILSVSVRRSYPATDPSSEHGDLFSEASNNQLPTASAKVSPSPGASLFFPTWPKKPFVVSANERERAVQVHRRVASGQEHRFPDLFRYGIRFRPAHKETDIYRTVVVDHLPPKLPISVLLENIRGGAVMEAQIHDTTTINGHSSAMIIFVHEHGARSFESRARQFPLRFVGLEARVTLLPTPTWPMSPHLRIGIMDHGHTRCLEVRDMPSDVTPSDLKRDLRMCHVLAPSTRHVVSMAKRPDGVVEVQFTSIDYAGRAFGRLGNSRRYRQCQITRSKDPCSRPWEDLPDEPNEPSGAVNQGSVIEKVIPTSESNAPILWKEIPFEMFTQASEPKPRTGETAMIDERDGRLDTAEFEDSSDIQRGRGFSTEKPMMNLSKSPSPHSRVDLEDTCSPQ
ncbi:MAG: hypothetical protein Q9202_003704 [Teloschistes flavicans]